MSNLLNYTVIFYSKFGDLFSTQVLRRHGDVFERTSKGYYHAHGRADDTMNLGGIKVCALPGYRSTHMAKLNTHNCYLFTGL